MNGGEMTVQTYTHHKDFDMIKGITLILGGQPYIVPPLPLGALEDLQDGLENFTGGTDIKSIKTVIDTLHAALLRNYPDLTREQVRGMVGLESMVEVMQAVMDISGLRRKEIEAGEPEPVAP